VVGAVDTESKVRALAVLQRLGGFIFGLKRLRHKFAIRLF
jgi:hypothetical protein